MRRGPVATPAPFPQHFLQFHFFIYLFGFFDPNETVDSLHLEKRDISLFQRWICIPIVWFGALYVKRLMFGDTFQELPEFHSSLVVERLNSREPKYRGFIFTFESSPGTKI